ncbi:MAG: DMT family transporter [Planctomycetes bacterium]|nr:DMT family transporter [Planctomycetota bacterium]
MHHSLDPLPRRVAIPRFLRDPFVFGSCCGLASAVGYTAANAFLRAVTDCDVVWVSCVKAFPTVAIFGPWLALRCFQKPKPVPWRQLTVLIATSVVCQLLGNVVFQWSLGIVGMAMVVPLTLGTMIVSSAFMGRLFLRESVTFRMAISSLLVILAIVVLSLGAGDASQRVMSQNHSVSFWLVAAGVLAACFSGVSYALLGVAIRHVVTDRISITATLVTVTLTGVVLLGATSYFRIGVDGMLAGYPDDLGIMILAGICNALAFFALAKSLQLIPVIYVNALNATQAGMAALAGIAVFAESSSPALWLGIALTVLGLTVMQQPRKSDVSRPVAPAPERPWQALEMQMACPLSVDQPSGTVSPQSAES